MTAHSSSSSMRLPTRGASNGLGSSQEVGVLAVGLQTIACAMQPCGDYTVCLSGPLRDRLLRYYAETADQVQRLLRVTANGARHFP